MEFLIADTFQSSLARLTGDEQKAVKTTAFDLQMNPVSTGMSLHRIEQSKDAHFWSARVSRDVRLIVHRTEASIMLCYVGHHDDAYEWARRRKLERHPRTGAAQFVEVREVVREIAVPRYVDAPDPAARGGTKALLASVSDDELLGYGVPAEWLADVKAALDQDALLQLVDHLPAEAAEAVLELATGNKPTHVVAAVPTADAFAHPDAQRRFRVVTSHEELQRALEFPWEKWRVFLHPAQRDLVEKRLNGPARASGSAGTGKTVVALHRAVHLARVNPQGRVLLTTFSPLLAEFLRQKLSVLVGNNPAVAPRIDVATVAEVGERLYGAGIARVADAATIERLIRSAAANLLGHGLSERFLLEEWTEVVDAWQLETWDEYRDVQRLGRKTRLSEKQRRAVWSVLGEVRSRLEREGWVTPPAMMVRAARIIAGGGISPYIAVVVDEAQDISVSQLRLLAALAGKRPDGLFFAGDLGQRIFQTPFSWKSLGVDIRGRSYTLRVNYRTSHQIRRSADRLLPSELTDVDGNLEQRRGTVSVFNGPNPTIVVAASIDDECTMIAAWIKERVAAGFRPEEIGVIVRSRDQLPRAMSLLRAAGLEGAELDGKGAPTRGKVAAITMHLAKGLEFRAVVVAAVDEGVVPLEERIETAADEADLEEIYFSERHLLYVACTRARDCLMVVGVAPGSEFLADFGK